MPPKISRDSISTSAPDDFFSMIQNPHAPPKIAKSMDSIGVHETTQMILEKNFYAKLSDEKVAIFVSVGKFLFIAIMLPPYILVYGVPKWLIVEAFPFIFHQGQKGINFLTHQISSFFRDHSFGYARMKKYVSKAGKKSKQYMEWVNRSIKASFVHLKHQVIHLTYRIMQPFKIIRDYPKTLIEQLKKKERRF